MKQKLLLVYIMSGLVILYGTVRAAYHHEGEADTPNFIEAYPQCKNTKLDSCALCHSGGIYENESGEQVTVGSCQWCHREEVYGYHGTGDIDRTLNGYGRDYRQYGRSTAAFAAIESLDSDRDGYTNKQEIDALHYPGDSGDDLTKVPAPQVTYGLQEIEALEHHPQFLLMNTSRRGDLYGEYEGVPVGALLDDAGILDNATTITVFSPDGYFYTHDLYPGGDYYYVYGTYPQAQFYYTAEADTANGGWCSYAAPACRGRNNGDIITVDGGLQLILAYKRDGAYMESGFLDETNRLDYDAEGPFRMVPPQLIPGPPDQSATSYYQDVIWPYDEKADHNSGYSCRAAVAIRIEPLPEGTVDFNWYEGGWDYVDNKQVIVYGAIASGNLAGRVTDNATKNAIAGAALTTDSGGYGTATDDNGTYMFTGLKPGTYRLTAARAGYQTQSRQVTIQKSAHATADFALLPASGASCPMESVLQDNAHSLDLLRRFRDAVLAGSAEGRGFVNLYYHYAAEIAGITVSSPALQKKLRQAVCQMLPAIQGRLHGRPLCFSDRQLRMLESLLEAYATRGGAGLQQALQDIREQLRNGRLSAVLSP